MEWDIVPEYISLLIIFILLINSRENHTVLSLKNKLFRSFLRFVFFEISISIVSIISIENYQVVPGWVNHAIQTVYFLAAPLMSLMFIFYIIAVVWEGDTKIQNYMRIAAIPYALYVSLVLTNPFTGLLYKISRMDGFAFGQGFWLTYLVPILYMLAILVIVLETRSRMEPFLKQILLSFPLISLIMFGVQMIYPTIVLSGSAAASASLIVVMYLQNKQKDDLKESEERYRNIFNIGNDSLFLIDQETGAILEANHSACRNYGYTYDEILGLKNTDMSAEPEEITRATQTMGEAQTTVPIQYHKKKDGTVFPVEIWASMFAKNGRKVLLIAAHDITERKRMEEKEKKATDLLNETGEIAKIGGWELDLATGITTWTQESFYIFEIKYIEGKLPLHEVLDFYAPESRPILDLAIQRTIQYGESYELELELITAKGNRRWVSTTGRLNQKNDQSKTLSGSIQDITDRKMLEIAFSNEKRLLETTLISVGDGVISTDNKGNIVFLNRAAEKLTGWTQGESKGIPIEYIFKIVNEITHVSIENIVGEVLKSGEIHEIANHTVLISKDGGELPIEDSVAPIMQENGEIQGAVLVFRDFSEKRLKQNEIEFLSYHDQLTGLYNRRFYEEELKRLDTKRNLPMTIVMAKH